MRRRAGKDDPQQERKGRAPGEGARRERKGRAPGEGARQEKQMTHYLALIPLSARVHRKQSRMTRLCIGMAVVLVAAIFGMADMEIKSQKIQTIQENGSWHAGFKSLDAQQEALLRARPEIQRAGWYDVVNYRLDEGWELEGTPVGLCGVEEEFLAMYPGMAIEEGHFPQAGSALISQNGKERLALEVGDEVWLTLPDGSKKKLTVSGFVSDTSQILAGGAFGILVDRNTFQELAEEEAEANRDGMLFVQFVPGVRIQTALQEIRKALEIGEEQVSQNTILLGLMGQSSDSYIWKLYLTAAVLAVLVILAGILMISGSLGSNIARRTEFFGMLRCLGMTPGQIRRYVRMEALYWCRSAVTVGLAASVFVLWFLCALLRLLSPFYFGALPVFRISLPGLAAGLVLGVATVLLAVREPARRASRVSALTAVSGNTESRQAAGKAAAARYFSIETALGMHHAWGSRKNFLLLAGSFAFTIILFLAFSVSIDFMNHAIVARRPYTPDLSIVSRDQTCSVSPALLEQLEQQDFVKRVYGRRFAYDLPALLDGEERKICLISYEKYQFSWAEEMLQAGTMDEVKAGTAVMMEAGTGSAGSVEEGSSLTVNGRPLKVAAVLSYTPFSREEGVETVICSEALFTALTGEEGYTILDIQLEKGAGEEEVEKIREMAGDGYLFSDQRMKNQEAESAYYAYTVFLYGFLMLIALISVLHIINSVGMSVSARTRQYGAMRAVGMSGAQLIKMVAAEAVTYGISGILAGSAAGLALHRFLFGQTVTSRWGDAWQIPAGEVLFMAAVVGVSVVLAVWGPANRLRNLSVVRTLSEEPLDEADTGAGAGRRPSFRRVSGKTLPSNPE